MTTMTAEEKKLLQAQHRLEEAQMRAKEVQAVGLSELEGYLIGKLSGSEENAG